MADVAAAAPLARQNRTGCSEAPRARQGARRRARAARPRSRRAGSSPTSPGFELDAYSRGGRRRSRASSATATSGAIVMPLAAAARRAPASCSREQLGSLVARRRPVRRPQRGRAGATALLVYVPARHAARGADPARRSPDAAGDGARLAHPDRARGGRRGRGLGALRLRRRGDGPASTRSSSWSSAHGANLRYVCDAGALDEALGLRHPARRGRARRQPRLGRARLRLGPRQGADGDQARRAAARARGSPAPTPATAPSTSTTTRPRSTRAEHHLRPRLPRRPRRPARPRSGAG